MDHVTLTFLAPHSSRKRPFDLKLSLEGALSDAELHYWEVTYFDYGKDIRFYLAQRVVSRPSISDGDLRATALALQTWRLHEELPELRTEACRRFMIPEPSTRTKV